MKFPRAMVGLSVLSATALVGVPVAQASPAAQFPVSVQVTSPHSIAVPASGVLPGYLVESQGPVGIFNVHWSLTGKGGCFHAGGSGVTDDDGLIQAPITSNPDVRLTTDTCAGAGTLTMTYPTPSGAIVGSAPVLFKHVSRWVAADATPNPVNAGDLVTITARLERGSWVDHRDRTFGSSVAYLQFRGLSGPFKTYGTGTVNGHMARTLHQKVAGCWRFVFAGTSTTAPSTSPEICVDLA